MTYAKVILIIDLQFIVTNSLEIVHPAIKNFYNTKPAREPTKIRVSRRQN